MEMEGRIMCTLPKIKQKLILKEICFLFLQFINILEGKFHCLAKANARINLKYQMLL